MSSPASARLPAQTSPYPRLGLAWIAMWVALAIHVFDEAVTGFLAVYNPTVLALHAKLGFWLMPTFDFRNWLTSLALGILLLASLTPLAFRNVRWLRALCYFVAIVLGILNALGHTIGTVLGHTVQSVRFPRPAPGFYSSPLLFLAAVYLLIQLRQTRSDRK